jgi:hypothetical protein
VLRLRKSLYGLKQAPRNWHLALKEALAQLGFVPCSADPCVFINADGVVLVIYVDDVLCTGSTQRVVLERVLGAVGARFKLNVLGEVHWCLGLAITRDYGARTLYVSQERYVSTLLENFGMADCDSVPTPALHESARAVAAGAPGTALLDAAAAARYRELVGSLLYLAVCTRLDIAVAVMQLTRHMSAPADGDWVAGKRVLRYLKGTKARGLTYRHCADGLVLVGYADASYATCVQTRRSVSGYVFLLAGAAVSWRSKLQPVVALSTTEAEYIALCSAGQEAVPLRRLLEFLLVPPGGATIIYEDNMGALHLSANPVLHQRSKHVDVRYHYIRELLARQLVDVVKVHTTEQLADGLTKALPAPQHCKLAAALAGECGAY